MSLAFDTDFDRERRSRVRAPNWAYRSPSHSSRTSAPDSLYRDAELTDRNYFYGCVDPGASPPITTANEFDGCYVAPIRYWADLDMSFASEMRERALSTVLLHVHTNVFPVARSRYFDSVTGQLERLRDGWAGDGSLAPSRATIKDIVRASTALQDVTVRPEVDVDEDGAVSCAWQQGDERFALAFTGKGFVIGSLAPWRPDYPPWKLGVSEEADLAQKLEHSTVARLIGAR